MSEITDRFPLKSRVRTTGFSTLALGLTGKVFEYWDGLLGVRLDHNGAVYYFSDPTHLTPHLTRPVPGTDAVKHPSHYKAHPSGVECIEITAHMGFNLGNVVKYVWRADLKHDDSLEDLRKARQYLDFEIALREGSPLVDTA